MPSVTLSSEEKKGWFSMALFKKNAARFWPIWVGYGVVQFFLLDMNLIQGWSVRRLAVAERAENMRQWVMSCTEFTGVLGMGFGLLFAMALFSYLMNSRAVGFMHALPIRREGLFLTNFTSGLCFFLVPDLIAAVIAILAGAYWGGNIVGTVVLWLVTQVVIGMFFFSFAVCCAMFTGHILALPVFYGILNVLVMGLSVLMDIALDSLLLGYDGSGLASSAFSRWCTPVWHISRQLSVVRVWDNSDLGEYSYRAFLGLPVALGYALVLCAVFTSIALWVYHARELERAGDVVTVGWMRPVFQYGLGFCLGLTGGVGVYQAFFNYHTSTWVFVVLVALWAMVGAFIGRMFLKKTLRVFADGWKGPVVLGVCMLLLLAGIRMDVPGYQRWTPDPAKVAGVSIDGINSAPWDRGNYSGCTLEDPEDIAALIDFHKALVSDLDALREGRDNYTYETDENGYDLSARKYLRITYQMADGSTVRRSWDDIPITAQAMNDPDTYAAKLQAFINRPNAVREAYLSYFMKRDGITSYEAVGGWLSNVKANGMPLSEADSAKLESASGTVIQYTADGEEVPMAEAYPDTSREDEGREIELDAEQAKRLWEAVQKDMAAGNLGRRYLLETKERYENCYQSDLVLSFLYYWTNADGERQSDTWSMDITLQKTATETLKVLDELGYTLRLVPWAVPGAKD